MHVMKALIFAGAIAIATLIPTVAPPVASGQSNTPTATATTLPTATATGFTATVTATPTATATGLTATPAAETATPTATSSAPTILFVSPAIIGGPGPNTITVSGTGFLPGSVVLLNGQALPTSVSSNTALSAVVPQGLVPGPYSLTVTVPGFSPALIFPSPLNIQNPEGSLFVPVMVKRSPEDSTALFLQNVSPGPSTVTVVFYDQNGFSDPAWTHNAPIGPGESVVFDLATDQRIPPGFNGSAVVQSPAPITGVVNRLLPGGTLLASDEVHAAQARVSAGSFSLGPAGPETEETVPVVFGGYHGYFTTISVQNTNPAPGTFTVTLFPTGSPAPIMSIPRQILPFASARIVLSPENGVPTDFVGTARVASSGGTLEVAAETIQVDTGVLLSYSGFPRGATQVTAPLLFKNYNGWLAGAQVVNVSPGPVTVNATIFQRDNPVPFRMAPRPLAPNESFTYYLPAIQELPDGFVGSGVFQANGPIAVVVQELNPERGTGMAYGGFANGTPNVSVPVVFKDSNGWDSGIQVQNLAASDTRVNVTYHVPGSGPIGIEGALVAAGSSTTFYQPDNPGLPPNSVGSALVNSQGGQPIVAIVNEVNYTRSGDASMSYEGINY